MIISYHYVSDIQAVLVTEKEYHIESLQELSERNDITILAVENSNVLKILDEVSIVCRFQYLF